MKFLQILILSLFSFLLAFGLVIFASGYQVFSFARFVQLAALPTPLIFLLLYMVNRLYPLPQEWANIRLKPWEITAIFLISIVFSLMLVPVYLGSGRYIFSVIAVVLTLLVWTILAFIPAVSGRVGYLERIFLYLSLLAGLAGMVLFLYMALQARMYGDDFCYHVDVLQKGYLQTVMGFYRNWSGRFFSNFVLFASAGFRWAPLIQILLIIISITASVFSLNPYREEKKDRLLWSAAAGVFIPLVVFALMPDPYKTLFWIVSSAAVLPVLILLPPFLLLLFAAFRGNIPFQGVYALLGFALAFLIATTHEVATLPVLALNAVLLLAVFVYPNKYMSTRQVVLAAFLGGIAGALVTFLSPGNSARHAAQAYPPAPDLLTLIRLNTQFMISYLAQVLKGTGWLPLVGVFILGYVGWIKNFSSLKLLAVVILVTAVVLWLSFIPGTYVAQVLIPARSQFLPTVWLVLGIFCAGLHSPRINSSWVSMAFLSMYLLAGVFYFSHKVLDTHRLVAPIVSYAKDWDARDRMVRDTSQQPTRIHVPWDSVEQKLDCVVKYYRIVEK